VIPTAHIYSKGVKTELKDQKSNCYLLSLNHVPIDTDLETFALLLQGLGKHELPHPVNALVAALDGEVVRLAGAVGGALDAAGAERAGADAALALAQLGADAVLALGDELEAEGGDGVVALLVLGRARDAHGLEGGVELGRRHGRARDGVVVHVDVLERARARLRVLVDRQARALERSVLVVPLVTQHLGLALPDGPLVGGAVGVMDGAVQAADGR
jgi:hypothetical protein